MPLSAMLTVSTDSLYSYTTVTGLGEHQATTGGQGGQSAHSNPETASRHPAAGRTARSRILPRVRVRRDDRLEAARSAARATRARGAQRGPQHHLPSLALLQRATLHIPSQAWSRTSSFCATASCRARCNPGRTSAQADSHSSPAAWAFSHDTGVCNRHRTCAGAGMAANAIAGSPIA